MATGAELQLSQLKLYAERCEMKDANEPVFPFSKVL